MTKKSLFISLLIALMIMIPSASDAATRQRNKPRKPQYHTRVTAKKRNNSPYISIKQLERKAKAGDAQCQYILAQLIALKDDYDHDKMDMTKYYYWLEKACDNEEPNEGAIIEMHEFLFGVYVYCYKIFQNEEEEAKYLNSFSKKSKSYVNNQIKTGKIFRKFSEIHKKAVMFYAPAIVSFSNYCKLCDCDDMERVNKYLDMYEKYIENAEDIIKEHDKLK